MTEDGAAKKGFVPKLRSGLDLTRLGLSMDEGYVASRIDGRTSVQDIAHLVGKSRGDTELILERLRKVGVLEQGGTDDLPRIPTARAMHKDGDDDYGEFIFPPALMHEECSLDNEMRKRVIWFHEHLEKWSHYELLQAPRRADEKEIKKAYFLRSKEWHPDRFPRGNVGSFKKMIDAIYFQVKEAYDVLSDPVRRGKYDETVVFTLGEDEIAEMLEEQRRADREKKREDEAVERRRRRNPARQRMDQARKFYEDALEKEKAGELLVALRLAQTAAAYDEKPEYVDAAERLKVSAGELRIGPYMRRGIAMESILNWDEAIDVFRDAVRVAPEHGLAHLRLAYNLVLRGRDPHEATTHAHRAVALLPDDPESHFVLGMCYEKGGMEKAAVRAFTRALELKPNHNEAKKRLKKLRWGF
jgi:tetratricopeptide (TPR) repeat protein